MSKSLAKIGNSNNLISIKSLNSYKANLKLKNSESKCAGTLK
jgi:hypothetical protein